MRLFGSPRTPAASQNPRVDEANNMEEELEYVWLGDVDTGSYATVFGSPNYQNAVRAFMRGEAVEPPIGESAEEFLNEYTQSGRSITSLIKTGFLGAHDYTLLDTTPATTQALRRVGGDQGLQTLSSLGTPRRERMKRQLGGEYDGEGAETDDPQEPQRRRARLENFQPGVQTYIWALDTAARKRQRTRMRRRHMASSREWELRYDAYLRRGGEPFRRRRTEAASLKLAKEDFPEQGKPYIEKDQTVTYWYDSTLKLWNRMVGSQTAPELRRAMLLAQDNAAPSADTNIEELGETKQQVYNGLSEDEKENLHKCLDKDGSYSLYLHQQWLEPKYALPSNRGLCQGLCSFKDGWLMPEGLSDGLPSQLSLAFDEFGDPVSTHVVCAACEVLLCRKCYNTLGMLHTQETGGGNLTRFLKIYNMFRHNKRKFPAQTTSYIDFVLGEIDPALNQVPREDPARSADEESRAVMDASKAPGGGTHTNPRASGTRAERRRRNFLSTHMSKMSARTLILTQEEKEEMAKRDQERRETHRRENAEVDEILRARREAADKARQDAASAEKAAQEAAAKAAEEATEKARQEAADKARQDAEKAQQEAADKARQDAEKAQQEAAAKAAQEAAEKERQEAAEKARQEAAEKAAQEAAEKARQEAAAKAATDEAARRESEQARRIMLEEQRKERERLAQQNRLTTPRSRGARPQRGSVPLGLGRGVPTPPTRGAAGRGGGGNSRGRG